MSRIGRKPVVLPKGVSLTQKPGQFSVKGPKGELSKPMPSGVTIKVEGDKVTVTRADDSRENRARHGLVRAHLSQHGQGRDRPAGRASSRSTASATVRRSAVTR